MELKVVSNKIAKNTVEMEITASAADLDKALDRAAAEVSKKVNIPGFRKGKIPRKILENYVGIEAMMEEAIEIMVNESYYQAVTEADMWPVANPEIEIVTAQAGSEFVYKATVDVKPEIVLGQYKGLEIKKEVQLPTDEEIQRDMDVKLNRLATMEVVAEGEAAANGDTLSIDFEGFVDEVPFEGGKAEKYSLVLGSGSFIPGFEDQLVGTKVGDDVEVKVTFPEQYHAEDLKGKDAVFKVKVHEIRRRNLPEMTDEIAAQLDEDCDTVEQLREKVKNTLTERAYRAADEEVKNKAVQTAMDNCELELPESMIERRVDDMVKDIEQNLASQGLSLEMFFQYTQMDMEKLREQNREQAVSSLRNELMLEAIAKEEAFEVTDADIDAKVKEMAEMYGQPEEEIRGLLKDQRTYDFIADNIKLNRALELITDSAVVIEG